MDERQFRGICQNALEGLATKKLNLAMLVERRARAQECRVVPETIARFIRETAGLTQLTIKDIPQQPHTFEPGRTPPALRRYESDPSWKLPTLADRYPRCSTDRSVADKQNLEWVTPGHPLFEAIRRHTEAASRESLSKGACFYSLQHEAPVRLDCYRARVVDGLGQIIHERLFVVEINENARPALRDPTILGNLNPASCAGAALPSVAFLPEASAWLNDNALLPFLNDVRAERLAEVDRIGAHIELSLTELLQKADDEIGRAATEVELKAQGAQGRLAQAEERHAKLLERRERRRQELARQRSLTLQAVERITEW